MITFTEEQIQAFLNLNFELEGARAEGEINGDFVETVLTISRGVVNRLPLGDNQKLDARVRALGGKVGFQAGFGPYVYRVRVPLKFAD